ncbi:MAG: hypothetical protein AAF393_16120 [Pseudomonadota bacterium]
MLKNKNTVWLWDNRTDYGHSLLNITGRMRRFIVMRLMFMAVTLLFLAAPVAGWAACYADYKAQRTNNGQLQLHYGVIELGPKACANRAAAQQMVARRIGAGGWQLLRVLSTFTDSGLAARRGNAGQYFLRY